MTWTFTLPIALSSANDHVVNGNHAATRAAYRKRRAAYLSAIVVKARHVPRWGLAGEPGPVEAHRWVTIRRLWGKGCRAWDDDNMIAACKALRDVMQRPKVSGRGGVPKLTAGAGLVVTDGPKWATFRYEQRKASDGVACVEIEITEEEWP